MHIASEILSTGNNLWFIKNVYLYNVNNYKCVTNIILVKGTP
jgi:hypothetical protein